MIKKIKNLLILTLFATTIFSCESVVLPKPEPIEVDTTPISYADQIVPIWTQYCVSCHGASQQPPDLTPTGSYLSLTARGDINLEVPEQSNIYVRMIDGTMPPAGALPDSLTNKVLNWIRQGAIE